VVDPILMKRMAVNVMGNKFASENMWDSSHRPEQLFTVKYIADEYPDWTIKTEYPVGNLSVDGKPYRTCILDIAVTQPRKIAIRLNGGYHFTSSRQELKDELQKIALEQVGWQVLDLDHHMLPWLFKVKKSSSKKTLKLATEELDFIATKYFI